ncbi:MAG: ATP-dependent zinc metalloprotease FtsH [Candidatus Phytoplasma sp. TWB_XP]
MKLMPRKKLMKMFFIVTSIAFLSYLIYDFNPAFFNNYPHIDYLQASKKLENKDYDYLSLSKHETFLRGQEYYILYLTENSGKKWQCLLDGGEMEWQELYKIIQVKEIKFSEPIKKHKHYFNIITNLASACFSFIWMYWILNSLFMEKRLTRRANRKHNILGQKRTTFEDVAGNKEEKEEIKEWVDFLKNPKKYSNLGAVIPKGIVLEGPPGTGKTLLAKALAGEAGVPFYAVAGSEFVQMYVGLGAARVRKLFEEAKENAPCIIFIDEIDVLGRKRDNSGGGSSQEADQTLNQLLTEMDGFYQSKGIIVMAATNRIDALDPALLRPGRFDRKVTVGLPDLEAREAILKVHTRKKKLAADVDLLQVAKRTPGMSGAELAAALNEATILAIKNKQESITMQDLEESIDKVYMGLAKKSLKIDDKERKMTAYHEAGHAVIVMKHPHSSEKVRTLTITPRGGALGYMWPTSDKEFFCHTEEQLKYDIVVSLGGAAAEELFCKARTNGVYGDLKTVTRIAFGMVAYSGMSPLGYINFEQSSGQTRYQVDQEVKKIVDACYKTAKELLTTNKVLVEKLTKALMEKNTLNQSEVYALDEEVPTETKGKGKPEKEKQAVENEKDQNTKEQSTKSTK